MKKIGTWIALLASVLLLAACGHHRHHPGGPGGPMGPGPMGSVLTSGRADVGLAKLGGDFVPVVSREPMLIELANADRPIAHWTLAGPIRETGTVTIRITGYAAMPNDAPLQAFKTRLKDRLPKLCPLADKPADAGDKCACGGDGPTATCRFRDREPAVFTYDICVVPSGGKPSCVDPTGMIR